MLIIIYKEILLNTRRASQSTGGIYYDGSIYLETYLNICQTNTNSIVFKIFYTFHRWSFGVLLWELFTLGEWLFLGVMQFIYEHELSIWWCWFCKMFSRRNTLPRNTREWSLFIFVKWRTNESSYSLPCGNVSNPYIFLVKT